MESKILRRSCGSAIRYRSTQRDLAAAGSAFALVIYSDQIQLRAVASNQSILVAQQLHPLLGKQILRTVFGVRINFVIAVAAVNAQRGGEAAYFILYIPREGRRLR